MNIKNPFPSLLLTCLLCGCASNTGLGDADTGTQRFPVKQQGHGAPAIVFQAGLGDDHRVWNQVMAQLGNTSLLVAVDRPGYGITPASDLARSPCRIAQEQKSLLTAMGVAPPYVLVGHSLGGLYQYVYARMFPDDVAAIVLLDPTHPRHLALMEENTPALAAALKAASHLFIGPMRKEFRDQTLCLDTLPTSRHLTTESRLLVRSEFTISEKGAFEALTKHEAQAWQTLLGAPHIETVKHAGHYIQRDQPGLAADAIREVVNKYRARQQGPAKRLPASGPAPYTQD